MRRVSTAREAVSAPPGAPRDGLLLSQLRQPTGTGEFPLVVHLRLLNAVLAELHELHETCDARGVPLGLVHGNMRPDNVFVTRDGRIELLGGVGVAERWAAERRDPADYLAPERVRGDGADRRSDIFAVGVMTWEAITGAPFWQGLEPAEIVRRLVAGSLPLHPPWAGHADPELFEIAECALRVDPQERYRYAAAMRDALESVLDRLDGEAMLTPIAAQIASRFVALREPPTELRTSGTRESSSVAPSGVRRRSAWFDRAPTLLWQRASYRPIDGPPEEAARSTSVRRRWAGVWLLAAIAGGAAGGAIFRDTWAPRSSAATAEPRIVAPLPIAQPPQAACSDGPSACGLAASAVTRDDSQRARAPKEPRARGAVKIPNAPPPKKPVFPPPSSSVSDDRWGI